VTTSGVHMFRKKPITIAAVQWTGDNVAELVEFTRLKFETINPLDRAEKPDVTAQVYDELHSTWVGVKTGQWVLRGVRGEFYPCDADVLAETYDEVASDA